MGSLGTGAPPGGHGLVGYEVLDPAEDRVFNELSWENGPDPFTWQPTPTVFQEVAAEGLDVTRIGPGFFDGSGLTNAALRGGRFRAASSLADRVTAAVEAVRSAPRALVYVYWGDVDKIGHVHGPSAWEWVDELESVDRHLAQLAAAVPAGTAVHITADHGMVDVPFANRVDLAAEPELWRGLRHIAWEPRATQLHVEPGATVSVAERWQNRLGESARVVTRDELVAGGWFRRRPARGAPADRRRPRAHAPRRCRRGLGADATGAGPAPWVPRLSDRRGAAGSADHRACAHRLE
jgi:hypothetical protein